jgi:hypothetical protein
MAIQCHGSAWCVMPWSKRFLKWPATATRDCVTHVFAAMQALGYPLWDESRDFKGWWWGRWVDRKAAAAAAAAQPQQGTAKSGAAQPQQPP